MPRIIITTAIQADKLIVFDLARSIELHKISTENTKETAISGRTSGLIGLNETVTWHAKHFGFYHTLTSKITAYKSPYYFTDEMVSGIFKSFKHEHHFKESHEGTLMTDIFVYESPYGILGELADHLFLKKYMTKFLTQRNQVIKAFAESNKWETVVQKN